MKVLVLLLITCAISCNNGLSIDSSDEDIDTDSSEQGVQGSQKDDVVNDSSEEKTSEEEEDVSLKDHRKRIIELVDPANIRSNLRHLTLTPHLGGTPAEHETAQWVYDTWVSQGLDKVNFVPYDTLLSYPSPTVPNLVNIITEDNEVLWTSQPKQKPLYAQEEFSDEVPFTFNGYSPPGNVTAGIVYANYGQERDFQYLEEHFNISVKGLIVIARYGRVFRANIVDSAERRGAVGVILYSDPADYATLGTDPKSTYPNTIMMPDTAAAAGTVYLGDGDPLTPFYPSVESAYRIPIEDSILPTIPVQPISYSDAWTILSNMTGELAPDDWIGGLNCTYNIGPSLSIGNAHVNLDVHTHPETTTVYNVIGVMEGEIEPDRYVVVGNHRDAWVFGAVDPSSGTAAMMEMSRALTEYSRTTGWRPRRSIIFCAWEAEEYGLIGSQEWVEQFGKQLSDKTIAYLNVDMSIEGNYTLRAKSAPLLYDILWASTQLVDNPDPEEMEQGKLTVFDTWASRRPDDARPGYPRMQFIGSGSDYKGFQHNLGVPCLDIRYTYDDKVLGEPLYHTLYETFALVDELYDQGFHFHAAITQLWTDLAVTLAGDTIIPLSLKEYAKFMKEAAQNMVKHHNQTLSSHNITMDYFTSSIDRFGLQVEAFEENIANIDLDNPLTVRRINDQIMAVERAFIDPRGLPNRPTYNHVVTAPSITDTYSGTAFSGLSDALAAIEAASEGENTDKLWATFSHHLGAVTHYVNSATKVLSSELW